ncbi:hypothetical protein EDB81DRAFT_912784 [Dactylonectria macrodidyma]|uniref:Uncharacterized protein n=1 Tax=Dactylonectria macrodidyma TaxID=307937 RepID=A0A9P9DST7_9HYPO|nr:hypothetical protein EDB81DRAFT_912784 [Dactylonectria macrodidyma]
MTDLSRTLDDAVGTLPHRFRVMRLEDSDVQMDLDPSSPNYLGLNSAQGKPDDQEESVAEITVNTPCARLVHQWEIMKFLRAFESVITPWILDLAIAAREINSAEVQETVLPLKDTVIKFSSAGLLTWPSFTGTLFDHLRPLPSAIGPANKDLWSLSYASTFSGKKIVTVPNTDKYTTPSGMLASGHFSNNQVGQLKVLVVLTSTDVVDKQEPVTPLRPDEYSTPVKEEKKRKVKQEDTSPAFGRKKRVKRQVKEERGSVERDQVKQEIHVKVKQEEPVPTSSYQSPIRDGLRDIAKEVARQGDVVDLSELEDSLSDLVFDGIHDGKGDEGVVDEEDKVNYQILRKR